jgi:UDP-2,3-diacylglucosamine pyrophosphatase LpxH
MMTGKKPGETTDEDDAMKKEPNRGARRRAPETTVAGARPGPAAARQGQRRKWRTIWISDVHLGTRAARSDLLLAFLRQNEAENLYLVGDVVDGWSLRRSWYWNDEHNRVLQTLLKRSSRGTRVSYVTGNHDEFLRDFSGVMLGGIALKDEAVHTTADGRRLLVVHGDGFDLVVRNARWLAHLGDRACALAKLLGHGLNAVRRLLGMGHWSLAGYVKRRVKSALSYVEDFELALAREARRRGFDGVVCGHVHQPALREIEGVLYCNDGDWVESCTALVEDQHGRLSILGMNAAAPSRATAGASG